MESFSQEAVSYLTRGEFAEARKLFERVLRESPPLSENRVGALLGLGLCKRGENLISEALEYFEQSFRMRPSLAAVENLLWAYRELGDDAGSRSVARQALGMDPLPSHQRARFLMLAGNA